MSIAPLDRPISPIRHLEAVTDASSPRPSRSPHLRAVPEGTEARGFALYVGIDEHKAAAAGIDLPALVRALRQLAVELAPDAQTHAAVALAPAHSGGSDIDVVRLALQEPAAIAGRRSTDDEVSAAADTGVVIDLSRKRVTLGTDAAALTFKEFELLQFLVLREGRTIARSELIEALWPHDDADAPNERTIDVHVRRLRSKLGAYQEIVRTVRGAGYRFDRHADVVIRHSTQAPSPDRF